VSCGTRIEGRFGSYWERQELADKLEQSGEYRLARAVKHGDCLGFSDRYRAERVLENEHDLSKHFDYRERECACDPEDYA
jgi:hypothetical protein